MPWFWLVPFVHESSAYKYFLLLPSLCIINKSIAVHYIIYKLDIDYSSHIPESENQILNRLVTNSQKRQSFQTTVCYFISGMIDWFVRLRKTGRMRGKKSAVVSWSEPNSISFPVVSVHEYSMIIPTKFGLCGLLRLRQSPQTMSFPPPYSRIGVNAFENIIVSTKKVQIQYQWWMLPINVTQVCDETDGGREFGSTVQFIFVICLFAFNCDCEKWRNNISLISPQLLCHLTIGEVDLNVHRLFSILEHRVEDLFVSFPRFSIFLWRRATNRLVGSIVVRWSQNYKFQFWTIGES